MTWNDGIGTWKGVFLAAVVVCASGRAEARNSYLDDIPNSDANSCLTCHQTSGGGLSCGSRPCLNPFGVAFNDEVRTWNADLRDGDPDGDGRTSGQELIYFAASYSSSDESNAGPTSLVTLPGFASGFSDAVATDECELQETTGQADPHNYTNCASDDGVLCTDNSATDGIPTGTRYFGFECSCDDGYAGNGRVDVAGDGITDATADGCADVDECLVAATCGEDVGRGTCDNEDGGYDCTCNPGYDLSGSGDSLTCADVDECLDATTCGADEGAGNCTNADGGYTCDCADGYFAAGTGLTATCVLDCGDDDDEDGFDLCEGDCDDTTAARAPGLAESCDGIDNDCDDAVDDGLATEDYFPDADGDGAGDADAVAEALCADPADGSVTNDDDCDDSDADVGPHAAEVTGDGIDNDCDVATADVAPADDPDDEDDGVVDEDEDEAVDDGTDADPDDPQEPTKAGFCAVGTAPWFLGPWIVWVTRRRRDARRA